MHFAPGRWGILLNGAPSIILNVLDAMAIIIANSNAGFSLPQYKQQGIKILINKAKKSIRKHLE